MHRWPRLEQPELEQGLLRMLHRQPAIVAVAHVCNDAEAELVDVERERFILISHIHTCYLNTLAHGSSFVKSGVLCTVGRTTSLLQNCGYKVRALRCTEDTR